ncbi:MAG: hypothetical protein GQ578_02365 [Desulfuromonadaceae bacterium]|nr:hypothetical protein [Desulfuromonadaceae bacterium]
MDHYQKDYFLRRVEAIKRELHDRAFSEYPVDLTEAGRYCWFDIPFDGDLALRNHEAHKIWRAGFLEAVALAKDVAVLGFEDAPIKTLELLESMSFAGELP